MKSVIKVFIILAMVFGFWAIFPIIFGAIGLSKLETCKNKEELMPYSALVLVFCSVIAGILMLVADERDLFPCAAKPDPVVVDVKAKDADAKATDCATELNTLKDLHDRGVYSDEEYNEKRKAILDKYY